MNSWLYLPPMILNRSAEHWRVVLGQDGQPKVLSLAQAAERLRARPVTVVIPVEAISYCRVCVPARSGAVLRQAVRYAVEDCLCGDIDLLHLAIGARDDYGTVPVIAVNQEWLDGCLGSLREAGIEVAHLYVDADLLPTDRPMALWLARRWIVGGDTAARMALPDDLDMLMPLMPIEMVWLGDTAAPNFEMGEQMTWERVSQPLAGLLEAPVATDLCQGRFAVRRNNVLPWKLPTIILAVALALQVALAATQTYYLNAQVEAIRAENLALYQERYPQDSRIVDMGRQLQAHLSRGDPADHQLIPRLARLADLWRANGGQGVRVHQVGFNADEGWSLQATAQTFTDLENLKNSLHRAGLDVHTASVSRAGDGVSTRFTLVD